MNIFNNIEPIEPGNELFNTLFENSCVKLEHIYSHSFKDGEWYDQDGDEWVILLEGEAVLEFKESKQNLSEGDYLYIKAHRLHRVVSTSADAHWIVLHVKSNS